MARLIAVSILTYESGNVRRTFLSLDYGRNYEEGIELGNECILASEAFDESLDIVRHKPGVLPSVALAIVIGPM